MADAIRLMLRGARTFDEIETGLPKSGCDDSCQVFDTHQTGVIPGW
jgi:hypothetical protein